MPKIFTREIEKRERIQLNREKWIGWKVMGDFGVFDFKKCSEIAIKQY
jgi:hypothetical protein